MPEVDAIGIGGVDQTLVGSDTVALSQGHPPSPSQTLLSDCTDVSLDELFQIAHHSGNNIVCQPEADTGRQQAQHDRRQKQNMEIDPAAATGDKLVVGAEPPVGGGSAEQSRDRESQGRRQRQEQGHQTGELKWCGLAQLDHVQDPAAKPEHGRQGDRGQQKGLAHLTEDVTLERPGKRHSTTGLTGKLISGAATAPGRASNRKGPPCPR